MDQVTGDTPFQSDIEAISRIQIVPTLLDVVCRTTGMGFAAVARVTEDRWIACSVDDRIQFGLKPGGELKVQTTICNEIREHGRVVAIDNVAEDAVYCKHATPAMYGFNSYISMPIFLHNGDFFGTLCAIDPKPASVNTPQILGMFKAFAELIAFHVQAEGRLETAEASLHAERATADLREQFIAVLGHDLRNPLSALTSGARVLQRLQLPDPAVRVLAMMQNSVNRMTHLIDSMLDLARTRRGTGLAITPRSGVLLQHVVDELQSAAPDRLIEVSIDISQPVTCDPSRIGQLASNLISNALTHGSIGIPVRVDARLIDGDFQFSVSNGGEPIPANLLGRLFEPFVRASARLHQEGLGLGLYIAHQIAQAHHGELTVTSNEDETRFTFVMPLSILT